MTRFTLNSSVPLKEAIDFKDYLSSFDTINLDDSQLSRYYFRKASVEVYFKNKDVAFLLVEKSFCKDSRSFCKGIDGLVLIRMVEKTRPDPIGINDFIDDISVEVGDMFIQRCDSIRIEDEKLLFESNLNNNIKTNNESQYSSELKNLYHSDQLERTKKILTGLLRIT